MLVDVEYLDLVSAIWILASNDETSLMTYEGVRFRLGLSSDFDVKRLIRSRGELFRLGAPERTLEAWKVELRAGRNMPSWIKGIGDPAQKRTTIERLSTEDVFRSQFRAHGLPGKPWHSERSSIEIIAWGLEHIDRLRKARLEARDVTAKSWQIWLVFASTLLTLFAQIFIACHK